MTMKNPELSDYLQAGYPCLFIRTVETHVAEERVREALVSLNMDVPFGVWKSTSGLSIGAVDKNITPQSRSDILDFADAVKYVEQSTESVVVVFHHVRQFISHYQNIQHLIDAAMEARIVGSHLILVGPHLELPPELRPIVTFIDQPLPSQKEIVKQYADMVRAYRDSIKLPKKKEDRSQLLKEAARAAVGLDSLGTENALALSLATSESVDIRIIQAQKEQEVRKSDVLEFFPHDETLENVGGFDNFKEWLSRRSEAFTQRARDYGLPYPRGMLIVGPAGTGKSLAAKASAGFLKLPLLRLDMGKVFRSLVGDSEAAIRMALQVAEAVSPVVLWMDEIEKGLAGASNSGNLDSGVTARVVSTILTWRQETTYPVLLVATANDVTAVPSMVYRKGRMDEVWSVDLPTLTERREILRIHIEKRGRLSDDYDINGLARRCPDYTGAEIEGCIEDAMFTAFDVGEEIATEHILRAFSDTVPQAQRDVEELTVIREWAATRARKVSSGDLVQIDNKKVRSIKTKPKKQRR